MTPATRLKQGTCDYRTSVIGGIRNRHLQSRNRQRTAAHQGHRRPDPAIPGVFSGHREVRRTVPHHRRPRSTASRTPTTASPVQNEGGDQRRIVRDGTARNHHASVRRRTNGMGSIPSQTIRQNSCLFGS